MVNRRSLVVGGGAAALAAVAGGLSPKAAAAFARTATTGEHVRRVVGSLDVKLGLVDLDGARARLLQNLEAYEKSAPRDEKAEDLYAWIQSRVTELTGKADPFAELVWELPQTRTLMAFAFAVYTQHQDLRMPEISHSMPVPAVLLKLERDFFPELSGQVEETAKAQPDFADLLQAGERELDRFFAEIDGGSPEGAMAVAKARSKLRNAIEIALITFFVLASGSYSC